MKRRLITHGLLLIAGVSTAISFGNNSDNQAGSCPGDTCIPWEPNGGEGSLKFHRPDLQEPPGSHAVWDMRATPEAHELDRLTPDDDVASVSSLGGTTVTVNLEHQLGYGIVDAADPFTPLDDGLLSYPCVEIRVRWRAKRQVVVFDVRPSYSDEDSDTVVTGWHFEYRDFWVESCVTQVCPRCE